MASSMATLDLARQRTEMEKETLASAALVNELPRSWQLITRHSAPNLGRPADRALHFRDLLYGRSRDRARTASSTARDRQLLVQPSERARARARHGRVCSSLAPQLLPVRLSARAQAAARAAAHAPWHRAACHCAAAVAYSLSQTRSRPRCCSGALASSMRLPIARLPPPRRAAATGVRAAAARRRRARAAASRSARAKLLVLEEELPRAVLEQEQELRAAARSRAGDSGVICTCSKGGGVPARARPIEPDRCPTLSKRLSIARLRGSSRAVFPRYRCSCERRRSELSSLSWRSLLRTT
jgi:hypothetical protein